MKYRLKIRLTRTGVDPEKIAFDLSEEKWFPISAKTPGLSAFGGTEPFCRIWIDRSLEQAGVWVHAGRETGEITLSQARDKKFKVKASDKIMTSSGVSIEFLDVPEILPKEEAKTRYIEPGAREAATRFVDTSKPDQKEPSGEFKAVEAEAKTEAQISVPADAVATAAVVVAEPAPAPESATSMILNGKAGGAKKALVETATSLIQKMRSDVATESATSVIFRSEVPSSNERRPSVQEEDKELWDAEDRKTLRLRLAKHIVKSLLIVAVAAEFTQWVAAGYKVDACPLPLGVASAFGMALAAVVAAALWWMNPLMRTFGTFPQYLRTVAMCSIGAIPWALFFSFPPPVVFFISIVVAGCWIFIFTVKYQPIQQYFIPLSTVACLALLVVSYRSFINHKPAEVAAQEPTSAPPAQVAQAAPQTQPGAQPQAVPSSAPERTIASDGKQVQPQAAVSGVPTATASGAPAATTEVPSTPAAVAVPDQLAKEQFFTAVKSGNLKMVKALVENRAVDINFTLDQGSTALHHAAAEGNLSMAEYLVSKKANLNAQDPSGTTPLMWAVFRGHDKVAELLIRKRADLNVRRDDGIRAIDFAKGKRSLMALFKAAQDKEKRERDRKLAATSKHHKKKKKHRRD